MGPPGAGKGFISGKIIDEFKYVHLSTGNLLSSHVKRGTDLGKQVKAVMESGGLVSDALIIDLVKDELKKHDPKTTNFLFDGFPRTVEQAKALDKVINIDFAINIDVPSAEILGRAADRWVHTGSGRSYSYKFSPPKVHGKDDVTGEPLTQRKDDQAEVVKARLVQYDKNTAPVKDFYGNKNVLQTFTGNEFPDLIKAGERSTAILKLLVPKLQQVHKK